MSDPCPRWPSHGLCATAIQNPPCPGAKACAAFWGERVRLADEETARRRAAGEPSESWATTAEDLCDCGGAGTCFHCRTAAQAEVFLAAPFTEESP